MKRALISVSDKSGIFEFAKALTELGFEILSTGGTAKALREAGLKVIDVAAYTGSPEILDGRVKTLHPKIHAGLLARRDDPAHLAALRSAAIPPIDLLVVNLYPFVKAAANPATNGYTAQTPVVTEVYIAEVYIPMPCNLTGIAVYNSGTISGVISGPTAKVGLSKSGPGTLILTGNSDYTGATTIKAGVLQLGSGGVPGSITRSPVGGVHSEASAPVSVTAS